MKFQPERFRQAGDYSYIFFPCEATPLLRTDRLNANQWLEASPGATERWLQSVSARSDSLIGTNIRPTGNESVTQILMLQDMDTL